jgi:hypothetical protein
MALAHPKRGLCSTLCSTALIKSLQLLWGTPRSLIGGYLPLPTTVIGGVQYTVLMGWDPMEGTAPEHSAFDIQLIKSSHAPTPIPSPQQDTSSSLDTFIILILEDSSSDPRGKASPVLVIKDKPSDLGLNEITDKELWIEAKKFINACQCRSPYCPSLTSKALIMKPNNQVASSWWEGVLYYYKKPPILDLFVMNSQFGCKGFKMITHIN